MISFHCIHTYLFEWERGRQILNALCLCIVCCFWFQLWNECGKIEIIVMDSIWEEETNKQKKCNKWNRYSQQMEKTKQMKKSSAYKKMLEFFSETNAFHRT